LYRQTGIRAGARRVIRRTTAMISGRAGRSSGRELQKDNNVLRPEHRRHTLFANREWCRSDPPTPRPRAPRPTRRAPA
jgi:hypothetical protein